MKKYKFSHIFIYYDYERGCVRRWLLGIDLLATLFQS
jgi:hypothetical protein